MATGKTFAADMAAWAQRSQARLEALARQSIQEVAYRVLYDTPVDTGFLRSSWQPTIGAPAPAPTGGGRAPPGWVDGARDPDKELSLVITTLRFGDTFYMVNNAAYAMRIENGFTGVDALGRHYNQQGRHFVENALSRWRDIVASNAVEL